MLLLENDAYVICITYIADAFQTQNIHFESGFINSYKFICEPSEESNQPAHLHSRSRIFAGRMKVIWVLRYPKNA